MKKWRLKYKEEDGFTLIEMLIVIMIVSLLLLLTVTNIGGVETTVKKTTDAGIVQTVESQKVIYKMKETDEATPENLKAKGYITEKQLDAYIAADKTK